MARTVFVEEVDELPDSLCCSALMFSGGPKLVNPAGFGVDELSIAELAAT